MSSGRLYVCSMTKVVDTVRASVSWELADNFENLVLAGTADLAGTGNAADNTLTGNSGANALDGAAGIALIDEIRASARQKLS